jgi:hypothetical protein
MYINIYTCIYVVMSRLKLALVHALKCSVSGSIAVLFSCSIACAAADLQFFCVSKSIAKSNTRHSKLNKPKTLLCVCDGANEGVLLYVDAAVRVILYSGLRCTALLCTPH